MATIEKSDWVVDIQNKVKDANPSVLLEVEVKMEVELWKKPSIYRVPACIKNLNSKAYKPQVVSFGPYHHGDNELSEMEEHKNRVLLRFLRRAGKPFEDFKIGMEVILQQLQDSYHKLDEKWRRDKDGFLKLMIVDGCFMLEVLRVATTGKPNNNYASNDPIFSKHGMLYTFPYIKRDMLMVENQLPLPVLEKLVSVDQGFSVNEGNINSLVLKFCAPTAQLPTQAVELGLHPLDLLHKSMLQGTQQQTSARPRLKPASGADTIRSAQELYEAGVHLRKSDSNSLRDISFQHGVLELPVIVVDDATEYTFLNLMAFERLHVGAGSEVTSYVSFMDNIIDLAKDVSHLHSKGIIQNAMGSDEEIATLFNRLSKDVALDPESSLEEVHRRVNSYCRKPWNKWRANLCHTHFRSPWSCISLLAAIVLLILTVFQTVYTVYPYYHPPKQDSPSPPSSLLALSPHQH